MGCLPCSKLNPEVAALNDCYPVSKDLVKSGPEYMPLSQDMSKLTYHAKNKPSSLAKIGDELEKRIVKEARGSTGGYPKSRAALLISLVILHKLLIECKRDLGLFARPAIRAISTALDVKAYQTNKVDLEASARASNCFLAFTQGTDSVGVDDTLTSSYVEVLRKFASLATFRGAPTANAPVTEKPATDDEDTNRARLIGLRGVYGAATNDTVFSMGSEFKRQAGVMVPALLALFEEAPLQGLKSLLSKNRAKSGKGTFMPDPPRSASHLGGVGGGPGGAPIGRTPSLSEHVVGEKGPSADDVTTEAFRCMYALVSGCNTPQAGDVLDVAIAFLDRNGWADIERCCILAETLAQAIPLQSRFIVPTRLVELLVNTPDDVPPTARHKTVLSMVTTVLTSSVSLVGLAVTDILSSLISVIERRVTVNPRDELLPALVTCVSSLGTHIYYADQINDIVEETTLQMMTIPQTNAARQEILRVLIHCMMGVMTAADKGDEVEAFARGGGGGGVSVAGSDGRPNSPAIRDKGKGPALESPAVEVPRARDLGRRNPIAPEVWQETLPLLCEATYAVRAAYARALIFYLQTELPRDKRPRPDEPNIVRFANALNAAVYTLAISSCLGVGDPLPSGPPSPTPRNSNLNLLEMSQAKGVNGANGGNGANGAGAGAHAVTFTVQEPTPIDTPKNTLAAGANGATAGENGGSPGTTPGTMTPPRKPIRGGRRVSLPLNRLQTSVDLAAFDNVATPYDYTAIIQVLDELHAAVPSAALETGAPMLFALDADAGAELIRRPGDGRVGAWVLERRRACRETCAIMWRRISRQWNVLDASAVAERALNHLPEPFVVPEPRGDEYAGEILPPPDEAAAFVRDETEGESLAMTQPLLPPEEITIAFITAPQVIAGTGKDAESLSSEFSAKWTVERAIRNSVERFSRNIPQPPPDAGAQLMAIPNASYHSFCRPASRAVDVGDLRDALASGSAPAGMGGAHPDAVEHTVSANGSISSATHIPAAAPATSPPPAIAGSPPRARPDANEILKEIFKEKKPRMAASAPA